MKPRREHETEHESEREAVIAGEVHAACACCDRPRWLVPHAELDAARRVCPQSGQTYLDRGDGLYAPDGRRLTGAQLNAVTAADAETGPAEEPDVISDRPSRSGPAGSAKSRIMLERATFAEVP